MDHTKSNMRYFVVFFFLLSTITLTAQEKWVKGVVLNDQSYTPEANASIVNLSSLKVTKSDKDGTFSIPVNVNDTLHIAVEGYRALKVKVTPSWLKSEINPVYIKDLSTVLDEVVINTLKLTGILAVDTKLIALADYPYYRDFGPTGFTANYNGGLNPINGIYNVIKRNNKDAKKINQVRQEVELIELMKTKYDRDMVSALLKISKEDIVSILQRCNRSERFIYTANDYQIFNAVNECYEDYRLSK